MNYSNDILLLKYSAVILLTIQKPDKQASYYKNLLPINYIPII